MDKQFKVEVQRYFKECVNRRLPGFEVRGVGRSARFENATRPIVLIARLLEATECFFAVFPLGSSPGKLFIEIGWKPARDDLYPTVTADRAILVNRISPSELDRSQDSFAMRLSKLCHSGPREIVWDLFSPAVWDRDLEPYEAFASRMLFAGTDEAMKHFVDGRLDSEFVSRQIKLVCGNMLECMRESGVPFLDELAHAKSG